MRFCLVNNLYPPYQRGGSERVIELAVNELIKNHQVLLLSTQPEDIKDCLVDGHLTICRLNPQNNYYLLADDKKTMAEKIFWHLKDLFSRKILEELKKEIINFNPEVVITHNLKGFSLQIPKIIRKLRIPHFHVLHDYQLIDPHGSLHRQGRNLVKIGLFLRIYVYFTKRLINSPDLVISPSKFVLDKHLQYDFFKKSKTAVLPNPCTLKNSKFDPANCGTKLLSLLYLGQIEPHKGVEFLVRTFKKWQEPNSQLLIVGQGSQLEAIKELAKPDSRIKVLGRVEHQQINQIFNQSNILVVPSIWWDNSPTVIYEAYSHRVPVLVSDSGGSKELVREGETGPSAPLGTGPSAPLGTGWIFKSGDENDLISKFNYLITIKDELPAYGQKGFEFVQQFSAEKYVDKLLVLCQELKR